MRIAATGLSLLILPLVAGAHHSRAEFSTEVREIDAEIVDVAWRNPHPILTVKALDGEGQLWRVESWQSANSLDRRGVPGEVFQVGDRVTVAGRESLRRPDVFLGTHIRLANGAEAILRTGGESFWGGQVVGSDVNPGGGSTGGGTQQATGIFRVWSYEDRTVTPDLPLTESAVTKAATFVELRDHPQLNCRPEGMPLVMDSVYPIEFAEQGDDIILRLERTDAVRTIHMSPGASAETQPATVMGYSVGRWDGGDLVITTTRIGYAYFDDDGTPQSDRVEIVERFQLSNDNQELHWQATATDPETFTEPVTITGQWKWVAGETIKPWDCAFTE